MTPREYQDKHGFTDEEMEILKCLCLLFKGRITSVTKKGV